jgi:HK97 family phage major capsid protein
MASITLAESAKLSQDKLVRGIIESIVTVDKFYQVLPFQTIMGNALTYNRENALGDAQWAGVGSSITAKSAATYTQVTSSLTTLVGDATVNGLIAATRSNINDQKAAAIVSKAKSIARMYQDGLINGTGSSNSITGLLALVDNSQKVATGTDGSALSFEYLDALLDKVVDKDGQVDYIMMHSRTLRSYMALLRGLGGASINEVVNLPDGTQVPAYRGVPIFRNDWIPINQTKGSGTALTTILAGTVDDGSQKYGIAGLTAEGEAGIRVADLGELEDADESLTRIKFYCGLANFSTLGLASVVGITN